MADKVFKLQPDDLTPVQRLAQIDRERAELAATIKEGALRKANEAVEELNGLGVNYELTDRSAVLTNKRVEPSGPCPVCKFETVPHHDGRNHKSHKEPFTDDELKARNLVRV